MGAWIETKPVYIYVLCHPVAPFMGAWIETLIAGNIYTVNARRSLHGSVD